MTVSTQQVQTRFAGDGTQTAFSFPFLVLDPKHVDVRLKNATSGDLTFNGLTVGPRQVTNPLTLNSDYGVSVTNPGGNVDFNISEAPATGFTIIITRDTPESQDTDYTPGDPFPALSHERALDKLTLLTQERQFAESFSLRLNIGDDPTTLNVLPPAEQRAGRLLSFDSNGNPSVTKDIPVASLTSFAETLLSDNDAIEAQQTLGTEVGVDVQKFDPLLDDIADAQVVDDDFIVGQGNNLLAVVGPSFARTAMGLGTLATQNASSVNITGGSISGITDLAVGDGGTGASTASGARSNLGLGTLATKNADLGISDGGTGASSATNARANLNVEKQRDVAKMGKNSSQTISPNTFTNVTFQVNGFDTNGNIVDLTNNRLIVPSGATFVIVTFNFHWADLSTGTDILGVIQKNGGAIHWERRQSSFSSDISMTTGVLKVAPADVISAQVLHGSSNSESVKADRTFLTMEVLYL